MATRTSTTVTTARTRSTKTLAIKSVFAKARERSYPYHYTGQLHVGTLVGGVPQDPKVAEAWLQSKIAGKDDLIRKTLAEIMTEQEVTAEKALELLNDRKNLVGFRRDHSRDGELYIEGRQLKAALKEAVSVACAAGKIKIKGWGETRKFLTNYFPEHCFITEERLYLGVTKPTDIMQHFIHSRFGSSISYQEFVANAQLDFTVVTDHLFTPDEWALIWTTGEMQGIGASRSQEYGRYLVTQWERTR